MHISKTIKRMMTAAAIGATIASGAAGVARADGTWYPPEVVAVSPVGRVTDPGEVSSYVANGRTRVTLPDDVVSELNTWYRSYLDTLTEWGEEEPDMDAYYGGFEEGLSYGVTTVLSRLGYLSPYYRDGDNALPLDPDATLRDVPEDWYGTRDGETFALYEDGDFGAL